MSYPHGTVTLMGSGELAESMARVHRKILSSIPGSPDAVFVDTPAGFEVNADDISAKAVEYFQQHFATDLHVAQYKNKARATAAESEAAVRNLVLAKFIFAGPGSPTYALRNWAGSPVWDAIISRWESGAHLVFASAAAITTGCCALPVYEIYKAGQDPFWFAGLDLFGRLGLSLAVIPHWTNTEGGNFDTRFCYMGAARLATLEAALDPATVILGIDEYTAVTIDPKTEICSVLGAGQVTVRADGREISFPSGAEFSFEKLYGRSAVPDREQALTEAVAAEEQARAPVRSAAGRYLHELAHAIDESQGAENRRDLIEQAHDTMHELSAVLGGGERRDAGDDLAPVLLDLLVVLRNRLRADRQFRLADQLREDLVGLGFEIRDTPDGSTWSRVGQEPGRAGEREARN
ncbi:MAG: hypothetical protein ACM3JD_18475 [Rudaea sp.]